MMLYKTIVLNLLQSSPLYDRLREERAIPLALNQLSQELKAIHEHHHATLTKANPGSSPMQIASEAAEMAISDLSDCLETGYLESFLHDRPESSPA